jgi:hypothetical protein
MTSNYETKSTFQKAATAASILARLQQEYTRVFGTAHQGAVEPLQSILKNQEGNRKGGKC